MVFVPASEIDENDTKFNKLSINNWFEIKFVKVTDYNAAVERES